MPADPAAPAPGVTEAPDATPAIPSTPARPTGDAATEDANAAASAARVSALLEEEDGESSEAREIVQPKGKTDGDQEEKSEDRGQKSEDRAELSEELSAGGDTAEEQPEGQAGGGEADEEDSVSDEHKAQWPSEALERIHKATAQREKWKTTAAEKEAEAARLKTENETLQEQLKSSRPVQVQPTRANPLANVFDGPALATAEAEWEETLEWATKHHDGLTDVVIGKDEAGQAVTRDYSAEEMTEIRLRAEKILRKEVPARQAYLGRLAATEQAAREEYPDLYKKGTPARQEYEQILQLLPELTNLPHHPLLIGWAIEGRKAYKARLDAQGKNGSPESKPKVKPELAPFLRKQPPLAPPVPHVRGPGGSGVSGTGRQSIDKARERVLDGGDEEAEVDFIDALRGSQRQPSDRAALV